MGSFKINLAVILMAVIASIRPQECEWTRKLSSADILEFQKISNDESGNIYLAGVRRGKLILQNAESEITVDKPDIETFIIKYNNVGTIDLILGDDDLPKFNNGAKILTGLMVDPSGDIVLIGYENLGSYNEDKNGFIFKLEQKSAAVKWSFQLGFGVIPNDLEIDGEGNIYITGVFLTNLGSKKQKYNTFGKSDIMVTKFSQNGKQLWSKMLGGESIDSGKKILINSDNQIIVVGLFTTSANFDSRILESSILGDIGSDIFIAFFSPNGECNSLNSLGSLGEDQFFDAFIDSYDNLYIRGYTIGALRYNSEKVKMENKYQPEISNNYFILTLDKKTNVVNKKIFGGNDGNHENLKSTQVDSIGNVFYLYEDRLTKEWYYKNKTEVPAYDILTRKQYSNDKGEGFSNWIVLLDVKIVDKGNLLLVGRVSDDVNFLGCDLSKRGKNDYFVTKIKLPDDEKKKDSWIRVIDPPVYNKKELLNRIYKSYGSTDKGLGTDGYITFGVYVNKYGNVDKIETLEKVVLHRSDYGFSSQLEDVIREELLKTKFPVYIHSDGYPKNAIYTISLKFNF